VGKLVLKLEVKMAKAYCPNCDAAVIKDNPHLGVMVTCRECGTELEIISTNPFEVDFPIDYDDEELSKDWDEDEDEEDEDEEEDQY
jgi:alpha-aminoadipate carrier protein LysW